MFHWLAIFLLALFCLPAGVGGFLILFSGLIIVANEPAESLRFGAGAMGVGFVLLAATAATLAVLAE